MHFFWSFCLWFCSKMIQIVLQWATWILLLLIIQAQKSGTVCWMSSPLSFLGCQMLSFCQKCWILTESRWLHCHILVMAKVKWFTLPKHHMWTVVKKHVVSHLNSLIQLQTFQGGLMLWTKDTDISKMEICHFRCVWTSLSSFFKYHFRCVNLISEWTKQIKR